MTKENKREVKSAIRDAGCFEQQASKEEIYLEETEEELREKLLTVAPEPSQNSERGS